MKDSTSSQIFFYGLAILFIGLKLGHVIDWAWYWVLAPLWMPLAIIIGVVALIFIGGMVIKAVKKA